MPWFTTAARCLALTVLAAPAAAQHTRVTVATSGQPDGRHGPAALSRDGRFVVFVSDATNLVAGDTNASTDVFVRDLAADTTTRVSLAGDGLERSGQSGATPATSFEDFGQREIDISGDGRFVVFTSRAPLVPGDTVLCTMAPETTPGNCADIYLRDRQANQTIRLSEAPGGGSADGPSGHPRISSDGRWVAFDSAATNLVAGDTNGASDVFLLDRQTGTLTRVSVSSTGGQGELDSLLPSLSDDGAVVAFASAATLLSAEPDPVVCINSPPACTRPFLADRVRGTTRRIPGVPARLTWVQEARIDVSALHVAPDGHSVAIGMEAIGPRWGLSAAAVQRRLGLRSPARPVDLRRARPRRLGWPSADVAVRGSSRRPFRAPSISSIPSPGRAKISGTAWGADASSPPASSPSAEPPPTAATSCCRRRSR